MIHPHQLYPLGKLYQEKALREAQRRHLTHLAKAHRRPRSEEQGLWSRLGEQAAAALRLS